MAVKIILIRPPNTVTRGEVNLTIGPPIGLAYLASSLVQAGHDVAAIDAFGEAPFKRTPINSRVSLAGLTIPEILERIPRDVDVVGVSAMFTQEWPTTSLLIDEIANLPSRPLIVVGGEHVTALPKYCLETSKTNICVLGEGEESLLEILKGFGKAIVGTVTREGNHGSRNRIRDIDSIPAPAWDFFPLKNYFDNHICMGSYRGKSLPIIATRGCPFKCTFCSNPTMWTQRWIARSPELVLAEIKQGISQYGAENFEFYDLTAVVRKDWTVQFCKLLIESKLNIAWQFPAGTRSEAIDEEVVDLLYQSGCKNLTYAPESGSNRVLKLIKKEVHLPNVMKSMRAAVRRGMIVRASFVIGFPGEYHSDIAKSFWFLFQLAWIGIHDMTHFIFTPYPGSALFEQFLKSGRIQLGPEYFESLAAMTDITINVSYDDHISSRTLAFYRFVALAWFYGWMFILRPWRLIKIVRNVFFREQQESRMEMALKNIIFSKKSAIGTLGKPLP